MARSLRSTPGKKQTYNLYDSGDLTRALKAINERIKEIEREWSTESQLYRDYVAPLKTISLQSNVRVDKQGRMQFKTGKGQNVDQVREAVTRMLSKSTKGEIISATRERMEAGKTIKDRNFITYEQLKKIAEEYRMLYHEIDSLIQQIYDLVGREKSLDIISNELNCSYIIEGHWGDLSYDQLKTASEKMKKWIVDNKSQSKTTSMRGKRL